MVLGEEDTAVLSAGMAGRTPALTARTLAALRATLANSSELAAAPFPILFPRADGPSATICILYVVRSWQGALKQTGIPLIPLVSGLMERTERKLEGALKPCFSQASSKTRDATRH